jgi:hypothetical protein
MAIFNSYVKLPEGIYPLLKTSGLLALMGLDFFLTHCHLFKDPKKQRFQPHRPLDTGINHCGVRRRCLSKDSSSIAQSWRLRKKKVFFPPEMDHFLIYVYTLPNVSCFSKMIYKQTIKTLFKSDYTSVVHSFSSSIRS